MTRKHLASVALAAGLGLLQGCSGFGGNSCCDSGGMGIGNGRLLSRLGLRHNCPCECTTVSSGPIVCEGVAPAGPRCDGPILDGPAMPPALPPVGEPPVAPLPRPFPPQQAQPTPAGPVSKTRSADSAQK